MAVELLQAGVHVQHEIVEVRALQLQPGMPLLGTLAEQAC